MTNTHVYKNASYKTKVHNTSYTSVLYVPVIKKSSWSHAHIDIAIKTGSGKLATYEHPLGYIDIRNIVSYVTGFSLTRDVWVEAPNNITDIMYKQSTEWLISFLKTIVTDRLLQRGSNFYAEKDDLYLDQVITDKGEINIQYAKCYVQKKQRKAKVCRLTPPVKVHKTGVYISRDSFIDQIVSSHDKIFKASVLRFNQLI